MIKKNEAKYNRPEDYHPNYLITGSLLVADFTIIMMVESQMITIEYVKIAVLMAGTLGLMGVGYAFYSFHVFSKRCDELLRKLEDEKKLDDIIEED